MEASARKRLRRNQIEKIVLSTLAVSGIMIMAMAAPNMLKLLKHADLDWANKRDPRRRIRETVSKMKRKGLIEFVFSRGKQQMRLTAKGARMAAKIKSGTMEIPKPLKWDGQWRIVIFDIPEKRRALRDRVRSLVTTLGFYRLQDSVWVHPYECEEIVTLLKSDLQIGKDLLYIIAAAIEFDRPIREFFNLPRV
jgi:DNA-binding transcriptional regulator PaaX